MALSDALKSGVQTAGKVAVAKIKIEQRKRVQKIESQLEKEHPAFDEETDYHCAIANYGVECYDHSGRLPKGTPAQKMMDSLFHNLENLPPTKEIEQKIDEIEDKVNEYAARAKEEAIELLKEAAEKIKEEIKNLPDMLSSLKSKIDGLSWLQEVFGYIESLAKFDLSDISGLVKAIKAIGKSLFKIVQNLYEPYINAVLLMIWWAHTIVEIVMLVQQRIQATMDLLAKIQGLATKYSPDRVCRCCMRMAQDAASDAVEAALDDVSEQLKGMADKATSSIASQAIDAGVNATIQGVVNLAVDSAKAGISSSATSVCAGCCGKVTKTMLDGNKFGLPDSLDPSNLRNFAMPDLNALSKKLDIGSQVESQLENIGGCCGSCYKSNLDEDAVKRIVQDMKKAGKI